MSKLSIVRQALETNPEVIIVSSEEINYLPDRNGFFCHTMDYWVAPKNGLYTAEELQAFMMRLVPNLEPTCKDDFLQYEKSGNLELGKLYFDEDVGQEKVTRVCTLTDEQLLNVSGFVKGQRTIEETRSYERRTWVRPFPNEAFARDVLDGKLENSEYGARQSDLKRYQSQQSLLQRILGKK
jgi:hypothetical protein